LTLFFRKLYHLWDNVETYCRARQATDDNMARAHCALGNWSHRHTCRICNTYWFYTATMVTRTLLSVTYIACLVMYVPTYSMEQNPSWEDNQFAASQEIPRIL
jgi:hypothetical protein